MEKQRIIVHLKEEIDTLLSQSQEINIAVALCSNYATEILNKVPSYCNVRLITGVDLATPPEVLKVLKNRYNENARVYLSEFFHPKVYIFKLKNNQLIAFIGSGNFTQGGFINNIELFYKIENQTDCNSIANWFHHIFEESSVITDSFLIDYKKYIKKWEQEGKKKKKELKKIFDKANNNKVLLDAFIKDLKKIRQSNQYQNICKERNRTMDEIRKTIDYDNDFRNIDIDGFLKIKALGNIRQSYKRELKEAAQNGELRKLFLLLCDEKKNIEERYRIATEECKIYGCNKNIITKILAAHKPSHYMLWNGVTDKLMNKYDIRFERGTKSYQKYAGMCSEFRKIIKDLDIKDFIVLDLMLLYLQE